MVGIIGARNDRRYFREKVDRIGNLLYFALWSVVCLPFCLGQTTFYNILFIPLLLFLYLFPAACIVRPSRATRLLSCDKEMNKSISNSWTTIEAFNADYAMADGGFSFIHRVQDRVLDRALNRAGE